MKLTCPACGHEFTLDQGSRAAELLALEKASQAFGVDWEVVNEYLNCFRRRLNGSMSISKRLRLAREVYELWKNGQFRIEKENYQVSRAGLLEGLRQVANRELTGLTGHNYLKKILRETARGESQERERQLKDREGRLMSGDRGKVAPLRVEGEDVAKEIVPGPGNCNGCPHWRGLINKKLGVRIPTPDGQGYGSGKCIRPAGHCGPETVRR
jgi:hypothetical protein